MNNTIKTVLDYIDLNITKNISVDTLADVAAYSPAHFYRLFLQYIGMPPKQYLLKRKLYFVARELVKSEVKVIDIVFKYGFESHEVFSRMFHKKYGVTPNAFRKSNTFLNDFYRNNIYCISDFTVPYSLIIYAQ